MMSSPRLSFSQLLMYGLPGLPLAALGLPLYIYLPTYYAEELGLGLTTVGLILLIARSSDVITDPVIGWLSDKLSFAYKRKLLIIAAVPMLMLSIGALFTPPADATPLWLLGWSLAVYAAWTILTISYTAWGAELSTEYDYRNNIVASREGFVLIGTLLAAAIPLVMNIPGTETGSILRMIEHYLLLLLPVTVLVLVVFIPEQKSDIHPQPIHHGLALLADNEPFRKLLSAYLLNGIANALPATLFLMFVTHVLELPDYFGILLGVYFIAGIAGIPIGLMISRRFNKHTAWSASMLWACAIFVWVPFLDAGDLWPFLMICILSGLSLGIDMVLPASIQADVVDLDRAKSGQQRTGLFFGLWGMATKIALALAIGIAFPLLDITSVESVADDESVNILMLTLLYGLLPIPFKLIAAHQVWTFSLGRQQQQGLIKQFTQKAST